MDKKAYLFEDGDWLCPCCGELNNTEKPGKIIQCTWCSKESEAEELTWEDK